MADHSKILLLALGAAMLAAGARAGDDAPRRLLGPELRDRIAGTTWYGQHADSGRPWFEYQAPDGNSVLFEMDGVYHGIWEINGDIVCYCYQELEGHHCFNVEERAAGLDVVGAWDGVLSSRITDVRPGNPHGLAPKKLYGRTSVCPGMV